MHYNIVKDMSKSYDKNIMLYFEGEIAPCECLSEANKTLITKVLEKAEFTGKEGQKTEVNIVENGRLLNLVHLGMGNRDQYDAEKLRRLLFKGIKGEKGNILISGETEEMVMADAVAEVVCYLNYDFDKYKEKKSEDKVVVDIFKPTGEEDGREGHILGEAVCITRDLINEPANVIYPETLGEMAAKYGREYGFAVEIKGEDEIEALGMESFLSVARAAEKRPKLIVMRYEGDKENPEKITGLVGKGLTYDTGGLSLKPTDGMVGMKSDMGGAATVIGAMTAAARMNLKKNIVAVVAACENSIGGNAYRPGDIIGSMNGKTIEVTNTDAEGRLTLIDAITYSIRNEKVSEIIDVATLTGGVIVALGFDATGTFTNSDEMYAKIEGASKEYGELVWRMPLFDEYKELIKSSVADLVNSGGRWASSASAAKFLEEFVEGTPWMHLDIAGTSFASKPSEYYPKGATGKVVRALYGYLKG